MAQKNRILPGAPYPLGATWDGRGTNFALFSAHAERVELCLFDPGGRHETDRIALPEYTDEVWHGYLPDLRPGTLYGYRVYGPYDPMHGHRFNHNKLLIDPYAKALHGSLAWHDAHFGYRVGHPREDLSFDRRDNARGVPKCVVVNPAFTWAQDRHTPVPPPETIIYELHARGFTMARDDVPNTLRGSFAALTLPSVVQRFRDLGITAVELLPVHAHVDDRHLVEHGMANYWGYNSLAFFAPDPRFLASEHIDEFKSMVLGLHDAGIEVILDVVYNHTAEGNQMGPTLSFRGIDNASYYRLVTGDARYYEDFTGCGNSFNMHHPRVLQLVMDSLRYWVEEMHVDGFRFDLASALARELHEVDRLGAFFDIIRQDPVLSEVKLIAEPWDLGEGGYQVGNFPAGWTEWNDRYRDTMRAFWKGDGGLIGEFAQRLTGSSDLYGHNGRRPHASINFVTAHDGFTLHDLVSYNDRHNEANLEDNRDGNSSNLSWNCGAEGETDDAGIRALRARQKRNLLATLLLSQGVPMLLAGDEMGRTQNGNNNAYCQDNAISWVDWKLTAEDRDLADFTARVIALLKAHPVFRRRRFFQGRPIRGSTVKDVHWVAPEGREMSDDEWSHDHARCLGMYLSGSGITETDERGRPLRDDNFLLLVNAHHDELPFTLPAPGGEARWVAALDTSLPDPFVQGREFDTHSQYPLQARSLALLVHHNPGARRAPGRFVP